MKYIDSWKNLDVFKDQLNLNERELYNYPAHWGVFIDCMKSLDVSTLLDLGCGSGVYKELCRRHLPNVHYTGMDYAKEAIQVAKQKWGEEDWIVADYKELTEEAVEKYDVLHTGAMLDVLPNGDEALSFLLELGFKYVILGRVLLTEGISEATEYVAYDKIHTYSYAHNLDNLRNIIKEAGYTATFAGAANNCTILLKKNHD